MSTVKGAIKRKLDKGQLRDVANFGAAGGFPGFCYYHETCRFYAKHKQEINQMAKDLAEELGEDVIEMVKNFNCIKDDYTTEDIAKTMFGRRTEREKDDLCQIDNALAWFALEEVARQETDN